MVETIGDFEFGRTPQGLEVYVYRTERFKVRQWRVQFRQPLDDDTPARTLAVHLLRRGTRAHPGMRSVARALESLYGASWSASSEQLADEQILTARFDHVDERHLPAEGGLNEAALGLFRELLLDSATDERGRFVADSFETERRNLRHEVLAMFDDKAAWAWRRFLQLWFPDEPWGRSTIGRIEDVDALELDGVSERWRQVRERSPARLIAVGQLELDEALEWAARCLPLRSEPAAPRRATAPTQLDEPRRITEEDDLQQCRLQIGHRFDVRDVDSHQRDALAVLASILGGGFHSRLFRVVREERGLAYDVSASIDRCRGFLAASAGVEPDRAEEVFEILQEQLDDLRRQTPSTEEFEATRRLMLAGTRGLRESPSGLVDVLEGGLARGRVRRLEEIEASILRLRPEDVVDAARRIGPPQMIYRLVPGGRS